MLIIQFIKCSYRFQRIAKLRKNAPKAFISSALFPSAIAQASAEADIFTAHGSIQNTFFS